MLSFMISSEEMKYTVSVDFLTFLKRKLRTTCVFLQYDPQSYIRSPNINHLS